MQSTTLVLHSCLCRLCFSDFLQFVFRSSQPTGACCNSGVYWLRRESKLTGQYQLDDEIRHPEFIALISVAPSVCMCFSRLVRGFSAEEQSIFHAIG